MSKVHVKSTDKHSLHNKANSNIVMVIARGECDSALTSFLFYIALGLLSFSPLEQHRHHFHHINCLYILHPSIKINHIQQVLTTTSHYIVMKMVSSLSKIKLFNNTTSKL